MASCGLCNSFGRAKIQYNHDLARQHAETHFLQLKIIDDGITTDQIFEKRFPDFVRTSISGRKKLMALCRSLLPRKSITNLSPHIICEKCDVEISIIDGRKHRKTDVLIEHACLHLKLNAYECRHCEQVCRISSSLRKHLISKHQLRTSVGHYRDNVGDFVGEISETIKACFDGATCSGDATATKSAATSLVRSRTQESRLTVTRQLFCHRIIQEAVDRCGKPQCRLCPKRIRPTDGKNFRCESIRDHAYSHMLTPLFRCRLCSEATFDRQSMRGHLRSVHALPWLKQNYECLADQYHSEVLAMINECYGDEKGSSKQIAFRNLGESVICKRSTQSTLTISRLLLCRRLVRKCPNVERVQCRLCHKRISVKSNRNSFKSERVMQHALLHLGKKLYQCDKCSASFVTRIDVWKHSKQKHASSTSRSYYNDFADQCHDDIVKILRQCYGDDDESEEVSISVNREPDVSTSIVPSELTIQRQRLCKRLTREQSDHNDRLECRVCNSWISVKRKSGVGSTTAMLHALCHLEKPIYRCKMCSETFITRNRVGLHLRTKHALSSSTSNYDCYGDQFHAEIVEILRKCYDKEIADEATPFKTRASDEAHVRGAMNGSKETIERQLFCHRLIRKFVNCKGKVECRLCKKQVTATRGKRYQSNVATIHAMVHLNKSAYRCMACSEKRSYLNLLANHLKRAHSLPLANNYESLADEYHSEILAKLRECYGEL